MKKLAGALLAGAVLGLLGAGSAFAADMAVKAPLLKAPTPVYNWTGCYINAGGGRGMWDQEASFEVDGVELSPRYTIGGKGWFGTVGAGCDYQVSSSWVIGILGDYDFGDIKGQANIESLVSDESEKWAWSVGGRVGYLLTPTILTYVSGGYTQAHFDSATFAFEGTPEFMLPGHTYSGFFAATGFDYNITFLPIQGLMLRSEYRYASYEDDNIAFCSPTGSECGPEGLHSRKDVQTVRTSLIWRWGMH